MRNERGFALVLTLIVTALLVALATEFVGDMYVATVSHRTYLAGQQAGLMAESGANGAILLIKKDLLNKAQANQNYYTSLQDSWATPFKLADEKGVLEVTITEESAKLNLNTVVGDNGTPIDAPYGIWVRLLKRFKLPPELADVLSDWRDTKDDPHPGGAEINWYRAQTPPVATHNGPLSTVEELALLKGFDPVTRSKLAPCVTVYSGDDSRININTAPVELLAALDDGMSDELARRIDERRKAEPFVQAADLVKVPGLETIGQKVSLLVGVKGSVFRIVARATVGDTVRVVETVARISSGAYSILYWREY